VREKSDLKPSIINGWSSINATETQSMGNPKTY
jgi:hypothetical protein